MRQLKPGSHPFLRCVLIQRGLVRISPLTPHGRQLPSANALESLLASTRVFICADHFKHAALRQKVTLLSFVDLDIDPVFADPNSHRLVPNFAAPELLALPAHGNARALRLASRRASLDASAAAATAATEAAEAAASASREAQAKADAEADAAAKAAEAAVQAAARDAKAAREAEDAAILGIIDNIILEEMQTSMRETVVRAAADAACEALLCRVHQLEAKIAESNAQAQAEVRQREPGVEALRAVGVGALTLDMLMPGGGLSSHASTFVTLDTHGLHTLYTLLSGHKRFLKTMQRGPGSSSGWSWQQRVLFALVRLGSGVRTRFCLQTLGLQQKQEDTFNRCVTYVTRSLRHVIRESWGRRWTSELLEK